MSRKNNRAKYARMNAYYALDEKQRADKLAKKQESRKAGIEKRAKAAAENSHKKPKKKPIVANADKNTRKLAKMMKKVSLNKSHGKKMEELGSSDSSDEEQQWEDMEVDQKMNVAATKTITKKKPLPRSYYEALKKSLRRRIKDGNLPDISKLDAMLNNQMQD